MNVTPQSPTKRFKSSDGTVRYIKDGKLHNPEGAALIHPDGKEEYYVYGILYSKEDFKKIKKDSVGLPWYKSGAAKARH